PGLIGVEGDDGQVRHGGLNDVGEVFVPGALVVEPDVVNAEQERPEGLAGRFGRVYDRDALHGHHQFGCLACCAAAIYGSRPPGFTRSGNSSTSLDQFRGARGITTAGGGLGGSGSRTGSGSPPTSPTGAPGIAGRVAGSVAGGTAGKATGGAAGSGGNMSGIA